MGVYECVRVGEWGGTTIRDTEDTERRARTRIRTLKTSENNEGSGMCLHGHGGRRRGAYDADMGVGACIGVDTHVNTRKRGIGDTERGVKKAETNRCKHSAKKEKKQQL